MRRLTIVALFFISAGVADAASQGDGTPPSSVPMQPPPVSCINARDSAEYVPGVDVNGRAVAPADLPGSTTDVQISTQVYAEVRTNNPQLRGAGVMVNLPGLQKPPVCPPQPQSSPRR